MRIIFKLIIIKMKNKLSLLILGCILLTYSANAQLTTAEIKGKVSSTSESLPGATVLIIHQPTGTQYATTTNENGTYNLPNLNPGGPYVLKVS